MKEASVNSRGFSLVEMMIALGIGSIVLAGLGSLMSLSVKANRTTELNAENMTVRSIIQQIVSQPKPCSVNLSGVVLDTAGLTGKPVEIGLVQDDPANPGHLIKGDSLIRNQKFGKLTVDEILLAPQAQLSPEIWLVKLILKTRKTGEVMGGSSADSEVSARVKVDKTNGAILSCVGKDVSAPTVEEAKKLNERICRLASNGAGTYNSVSDSCSALVPEAGPSPNPSAAPSRGPILLSDEICKLASGGKLVYDAETNQCTSDLIRVVGSREACACPPDTRIADCKGRGPDFGGLTSGKCMTMSDGVTQTCAQLQSCNLHNDTNSASCRYTTDPAFAPLTLTAHCDCDCLR